ncbi:CarD family transcriptional regulator [Methylocystis parvus]|uniref:CarD family transcriptional regulator n=1 Tax=Methylocystis parvus TaxID=134 RepID=UPI00036734F9|nr:CarD family transcriptional regulator [Methylocystis parvus]WBK00449.1 CarD family transcriptional regulator [Methylocystis parvus OBBP]
MSKATVAKSASKAVANASKTPAKAAAKAVKNPVVSGKAPVAAKAKAVETKAPRAPIAAEATAQALTAKTPTAKTAALKTPVTAKVAPAVKAVEAPKAIETAKATQMAKPAGSAKAAAPAAPSAAKAVAPAATQAAPKPARDIAPPSPAQSVAPAAPLAAGKTSSTTTAGEDKKLAKKSEPPVATATPVAAEKTAIDTKAVAKPTPAPAKAKPAAPKHGFKLNEFIVYPAHGVGQIVGVETQEVAGFSLELFVVSFIKDKMILKVPTSKVANVGMRKLAEAGVVEKALGTLSGRARIKRTMWSRRAQEYEAKINSGDLVTIAEVVRDLYRSDTQPEQSYSERQLYEAALDRMAREVAAVRKLIDSEALKLIESFLQKGPRRGQKADADVADEPDEEDVDRAA